MPQSTPSSRTPGRRPAASPRPAWPADPRAASTHRSSRGSFVAGLGIGLAIGAAVALLFAPQTGTETRRALRRGSKRVSRRAGDAWSDMRYELSRAKRALRRKRRENEAVEAD